MVGTFRTLCTCAREKRIIKFVIDSLDVTLRDIDISLPLTDKVIKFIKSLARTEACIKMLNREYFELLAENKSRLCQEYSKGYQLHRRRFNDMHVASLFKTINCKKYLDIGCGSGELDLWLVEKGLASSVTGVDIINSSKNWNLIRKKTNSVKFYCVGKTDPSDYMSAIGEFDCAILFWVLHHTTIWDAECILTAIASSLNDDLKVVVLEDSYETGKEPLNDPFGFWAMWKDLDKQYLPNGKTKAWGAQSLLDFTAVRILGQSCDMPMTFHYRDSNGWTQFFEKHGFSCIEKIFTGFPNGRDIATPQVLSLFAVNP